MPHSEFYLLYFLFPLKKMMNIYTKCMMEKVNVDVFPGFVERVFRVLR